MVGGSGLKNPQFSSLQELQHNQDGNEKLIHCVFSLQDQEPSLPEGNKRASFGVVFFFFFKNPHLWAHFTNLKGCTRMFCFKSNKSYCDK